MYESWSENKCSVKNSNMNEYQKTADSLKHILYITI